MGGPRLVHPCVKRTPLYWLRPRVLLASRRKLRVDGSNRWRYAFGNGHPEPTPEHSRPFADLVGRPGRDGFRFLILGDTGEGDASQIGTLPLIRALEPDFIVINGDVVYPAGRMEDYDTGFFKPYRGLGCPIWAVPGNHEYYSSGRGREFWEVFCSEVRQRRWDAAGLRLVPQPGTYWELGEPGVPLVVLGVDSGLKARLDGTFRMPPDRRQLAWLDQRLHRADRAGLPAIVLFHIPALAKQRHLQKKGLTALHRVLAAHPAVRLVVCGHWHNYQRYSPAQFGSYLEAEHGAAVAGPAPDYIVSGGGGAFLHGTVFSPSAYGPCQAYPSPEWWRANASLPDRLVHRMKLDKWLIAHAARLFGSDAATDTDEARVLSFLLVEVGPASGGGDATPRSTVTPVFMDHVDRLFPHVPDGAQVDLCDPATVADPDAVEACLQRDDRLVLEEGPWLP